MCTLIVGREVLGPGTVVFGANRDENPDRPTDPPGVLRDPPRVVGGRDRVSGGTWLALTAGMAAVAMLNRRPPPGGAFPPTRSRGLLALDVATAGGGGTPAEAALAVTREQCAREQYAPFSIVFLSRDRSWVLSWDGRDAGPPRVTDLAPGWHVVTHRDLDDPGDPRTARLLEALHGFAPDRESTARARMRELLSLHASAPGRDDAVCLHDGPMPTVSWAFGSFSPEGARYFHGEGRPCETAPVDLSGLLAAGSTIP